MPEMLNETIGSGGGINSTSSDRTRGGGAIGIFAKEFNVFGRIDASGYPDNMNGFSAYD